MTISIQPATVSHARAIAQVKAGVCPDEPANEARIARILADELHATYAAYTDSGQLVGFVDGFPTTSREGLRRWELDLLAVAPAYHGQKIGQRLMKAMTQHAQQHGAACVRALVQAENIPCQKALQRCGYIKEMPDYMLMVSDLARETDDSPAHNGHLLPVNTMTYDGLWLEADWSAEALQAAQKERTRRNLDIAGVLVAPPNDALAAALGYSSVNRFHWWIARLV